MKLLSVIRERWHPLYHARKFPFVRWFGRQIDIPVPVSLPDVSFPVYVRLYRDISHVLDAGVEAMERANLAKILKERTVNEVWDVGANFGLYGFIIKSIFPEAKIRLFEPDPDNTALIERTIARIKLRNITIDPRAVSDVDGNAEFTRDMITGSTGALTTNRMADVYGEAAHLLAVETIRLDSVEGRPDFIKIDIEGHEAAAIRGAVNTLRNCRPIVMFETLEDADADYAEISTFLRNMNYRLYDLATLQEGKGENNIAIPD